MENKYSLQEFMDLQSKKKNYFILTESEILSEISIIPFSLSKGVLHSIRVSAPVDCISEIYESDITIESQGRIYNVVNLVFVGEIGSIFEKILNDLIKNHLSVSSDYGAIQSEESGKLERSQRTNFMKPLRDWCGWHWPTR